MKFSSKLLFGKSFKVIKFRLDRNLWAAASATALDPYNRPENAQLWSNAIWPTVQKWLKWCVLGLDTSWYSCQTARWRPACCWLGWRSVSIGDPSKSHLGGSGAFNTIWLRMLRMTHAIYGGRIQTHDLLMTSLLGFLLQLIFVKLKIASF